MPANINYKALGLNFSPNQLEAPAGSLSTASNVIIRRDNVVESRRGFKLYGDSFGTITDRAKQLIEYKNRILRHFATTLQYDDGSGNFTSFAGEYSEPDPGYRIKSTTSNGNLYFTTAEGIKKISAKNVETDLTSDPGFITQAGGVKAIDFTATLDYTPGMQDGFLPQDSVVSYRVVWGIKDRNDNLVLGSPSQPVIVYNPLQPVLIQDFMRLLGAIDNLNSAGSLIDDGDYVDTLKLTLESSVIDLQNNLVLLASKLDNDILYADDVAVAPLQITSSSITAGVCTITFSSGDPTTFFDIGSKIFLAGFSPTAGSLSGGQVITNISSTTIDFLTTATGVVTLTSPTIVDNEYRSITEPVIPTIPTPDSDLVALQDYMNSIILELKSEPVTVIPAPLQTAYITPLNLTTSANVELVISIPDDITSDYFFQIYRSAIFQATDSTVLSEVFPNDELQLVYEAFPTTAELEAREVTVIDIVPDAFRGANLYTNPVTGEGILQANDFPPFAKDINRFKNVVFYANTSTKHRMNLSLLGVANLLDEIGASRPPILTISDVNSSSSYTFVEGVEEETTITASSGAGLATSGPGTYFLINSANNQTEYYVWYEVGTSVDPAISGKTGIRVAALAGDTDAQVAAKTRTILSIYINDFIITGATNQIIVTNTQIGYTDDAEAGTSTFLFSIVQGVGEKAAQTTSTWTTAAGAGLAGLYFTLNTGFDRDQYYVWFKVNGAGVDPVVANRTGIIVNVLSTDTATQVAEKIVIVLNDLDNKFIASSVSSTLTILNYTFGPSQVPTVGTSGFTLTVDEVGALEVVIPNLTSPAQAIDATSRSLVSIINLNTSSSVYAYYLSGIQDVPGKMFLEARELSFNPFYLVANNEVVGESFNPDLTPEIDISTIATGSPSTMLITTSTPHGLINQDEVLMTNTNSIPNIDGVHTIEYISPTTFRIPVSIVSAGNQGSLIKLTSAATSENETKPNRVYYSKFQQPEAVPIVNWVDVGTENKEILRIFPLRNSLFVFKEDGLFRISGEFSPWNVALFDSSCVLVAPDSVAVSNNLIYGWTLQGISAVSESGVTPFISRPIDTEIQKLSSFNYPNFSTATWGVGYESDNSYLVYTIRETTDDVATIGYRYSNLTNSWTTFNKTNTCGINTSYDDRLYLGDGDSNFIEQERKTFTRTDYADHELSTIIGNNKYHGSKITLSTVSEIEAGDVFFQEQTLSIYTFNKLLEKLDLDPDLGFDDYFSSLEAVAGDNLRLKLEALANKLDSDPNILITDFAASIATENGTITSITAADPTVITSAAHGLLTNRVVTITGTDSLPLITGSYAVTVIDANTFSIPFSVQSTGTTGFFVTSDLSFDDIMACFNIIIEKLNGNSGAALANYDDITNNTNVEAIIVDVDYVAKTITLRDALNFVVGEAIIYKFIPCEFIYTPNVMGDAVGFKHMREATIMFSNKAFTSATLSFATDLLPEFIPIDFNGDGNGIFGMGLFGGGFFGGASNAAPFRTYIPRQCQRCRYIVPKFEHATAREQWAIYGVTLTGEDTQSSRAYR